MGIIKNVLKSDPVSLSAETRRRYGMACGLLGIILNALLFAGKLFAGMLSGSVAVTADAFNNLSDAGSSIVSMLGFKLAGQKADSYHPFGHGRMEYVAGLIVAMLIVLMGAELAQSGLEKIAEPQQVTFTALTAVILSASIAVKLFMFAYNRVIGSRIGSVSMLAASTDSISDTAATAVVLISAVVSHFTGIQIDGWCGTAVGLFIIYAGCRAAYDTVSPLLGQRPSGEFVENVKKTVLAHREIEGVHDIVVHNYGPECVMVTLHAEVPAEGDILALHDAIDAAERDLEETLGCIATIHMDPVVNDADTRRLREETAEAVKRIDQRITIHDFRAADCSGGKRLSFDALVPFGMEKSDEELTSMIRDSAAAETGCEIVVKVEKGYV